MSKYFLTHEEIDRAARHLSLIIAAKGHRKGYAIPRGGIPAAYAISKHFQRLELVDDPEQADFFIDDLIDSGETRSKYDTSKPFYALFDKQTIYKNTWLIFPWESNLESSVEDVGLRLLQFIGEDASREGLIETPARFAKAWQEWTNGYSVDLSNLFKNFSDGAESYDQLILIDPIPFYSHCEHHLAPFFGTAHIGYIPDGKIAGLSKFCRLVDAFAHRLQVQERLTTQIADFINDTLHPLGVAVTIRARHFCMESRGVRKIGTGTTTSALRGVFQSKTAARAEFFSLVQPK